MEVLLIGTGYMGCEYAQVLNDLNINFKVIGNSSNGCRVFKEKTSIEAIEGGIEKFAKNNDLSKYYVINAVNVEYLYEVTQFLLKAGVKRILVEKPVVLYYSQVKNLLELSKFLNADIFVAYNRRFYQSVLTAKKMIEEDGGLLSFNFEFTEWSHIIEKLDKPKEVLNRWLLANSTHVIDLAFYIGGEPKELVSFVKGSLSWHPSGSIFYGSGNTEKGALFSYFANWESAGRWGVEFLTKKNKYILKPLEKVTVQKKGTIAEEEIQIDYSLDKKYKPGLYLQVKKFLDHDEESLCNLNEFESYFKTYLQIGNYDE